MSDKYINILKNSNQEISRSTKFGESEDFSGENDKLEKSKILKPVIMNTNIGKLPNDDTVSYKIYNSFNYSLLFSNGIGKPGLENKITPSSLGITSPNQGEGKTTAACNLAVALSLSTQYRTVLVDLNFFRPQVHKIFDISPGPGITDALMGDEIFVTQTQIENLSVMTAGSHKIIPPNKMIFFNQLAASLFKKFEFIIVDLPSADRKNFPTVIANQLNGLIVVVESRKTKRRDIDRMFRQINEQNVLGFVLNKINEDDF